MSEEQIKEEKLSGSEEEEEINEESGSEVEEESMDLMTAVQKVLKSALRNDSLAKGLNESIRALDSGRARLCVLASDVDDPKYVNVITTLCSENNIQLIKAPSRESLGEWVGLCKIDEEGVAQKIIKTSCVVVKEYGDQNQALNIVLKSFNKN
ncbi:40S ribosomal protein S12 [Anaeramoeba flamelloides]|uniref:40S ribosomal protein S12 n=1 Tax=Anaeramoeba flamelloides TaxID=1746091 RepID=A0AAV7ZS82_9EUKA|nr:40S ribosomal protein S12 [Anaeramoeba flamelloides]KAJ6254259.1 40S ribosomal protein S12 [Anaeramoeba flamelloides]|eukprot:Anaeramoba_flamelloidesc42675_g1_i1.p1 GENE.c42675_g1_i1~~c42675_g1_i1.p1  ORF type:complete len:161 (+),score=58.79 c42675_g1_i1:27-485(+)